MAPDDYRPIDLGGEATLTSHSGKLLFKTLRSQDHTVAEVAVWYREVMKDLSKMIDTNEPLAKQVLRAEQLGETILKGALQAIHDSDLVGLFKESFVRPTVKQLKERIATSGEVELKEVLAELLKPVTKNRFVFETGACFAAGTLVHTKEGLKPIEQIKVGAWVLSRPENPELGTQTDYKRVVRTMVHHDKPVIYGSFSPVPRRIPGNAYHTDRPSIDLIMTPDHPFWLQGVGWTAAALLREDLIDWRLFKDGVVDLNFVDYQGETLLGGYSRQVLNCNRRSGGMSRSSRTILSTIYIN